MTVAKVTDTGDEHSPPLHLFSQSQASLASSCLKRTDLHQTSLFVNFQPRYSLSLSVSVSVRVCLSISVSLSPSQC